MSSVIEDLAALPRFLTVKETCAFLGVSASTVKRFVKSGDLRQWTPERGHRKITRDSVARLVGVDPPPSRTGGNRLNRNSDNWL